jgi:hypothetical protein
MGAFKNDIKLLADLDALIKEQERSANLDPVAKDLAGALFPGIGGKLVNAGQRMAAQKIDTLTRVKERLVELIEAEHDKE